MPVIDKNGEQINIGDTVSSKSRGGKHAGVVTDIVETPEDAEKKGVKHPPKDLFEDQHGAYHPIYIYGRGKGEELIHIIQVIASLITQAHSCTVIIRSEKRPRRAAVVVARRRLSHALKQDIQLAQNENRCKLSNKLQLTIAHRNLH